MKAILKTGAAVSALADKTPPKVAVRRVSMGFQSHRTLIGPMSGGKTGCMPLYEIARVP